MLTLYLVRHGETAYNLEGRIQGHMPIPLNERGRKQARRLALRLGDVPLAAIYSSDLPRAVETAEIVASTKDLTVQTDARFRERNLGHWQGRLYREVKEELEAKNWVSHENGESLETVRERALEGLDTLTAKHDGQSVLLVAHGGSCHAILSAFAGPDYGHAFHTWHNTAISTLAWENPASAEIRSGWRILDLYDDAHLEGDAVSFAEATAKE